MRAPASPPHRSSRTALARRLALALLALAASVPLASAALGQGRPARGVHPEARHLRALAWRSIGPANCGGRISAIAPLGDDPRAFYVGYGSGGVFRTGNFGTTWTPVFDDQPVASIGAVAVWKGNPSVVWVGTGEANSRNSSSWGNGVHRSTDGGATWRHLGLEATHVIARVVPHPADSNVAYVAALGRLWGPNPERGVFKTTDGGRTWQHVLRVDARTGAVDLVMDPRDPDVLYAAMYARARTPWSFTSGGGTGGIFRTRDGGRTWTKLTAGLPEDTGRIGLDVYRANPDVLYAVIESDAGGRIAEMESKSRAGGVFRSRDGGDTWERLSPYAPRMFYFAQIRVQPDDSSRVYVLGVDLWVSDDGGVTFRGRGARNLHPDFHDLHVSKDGRTLLLGSDGGLYVSHDRGASWDFVNNLATGQFYNVAVDMREPYHVYGGLQDNQTWGGPSRTRFHIDSWLDEPTSDGILNDHWYCLGGGDGFQVAVDPTNPDLVYYESQEGRLQRVDLAGGRERRLRPVAKEGEPEYRFNWNTPFMISPHDPSVLWMGGNKLFRLTDRGETWAEASPDLTTRDPERMATGGSGAETHCTIVTLDESPLRAGLVWVGTDDGKVWVTPDGGRTWNDLTRHLRGAPAGLYVSRIEASHHDPATAYLALDGHRTNVLAPYVFVTRDLGRTWTAIAGDLPADGPVKVVREDPVNPDLLYAGTEFGFFLSLDRGRTWLRHREGLPPVPVDDIVVHPRDHDVVIGTHGRSVYVLDDVSALQHWSARALEDSLTLFPPRKATAFHSRTLGATWGQRMFRAKNPPFGATLQYYVPRDLDTEVSIAIADSAGRTVRTLTGPGRAGLHRVQWDLQALKPSERIGRPEWSNQPLFVPEGRYTVKATAGRSAPRTATLVVRHAPLTQEGVH